MCCPAAIEVHVSKVWDRVNKNVSTYIVNPNIEPAIIAELGGRVEGINRTSAPAFNEVDHDIGH